MIKNKTLTNNSDDTLIVTAPLLPVMAPTVDQTVVMDTNSEGSSSSSKCYILYTLPQVNGQQVPQSGASFLQSNATPAYMLKQLHTHFEVCLLIIQACMTPLHQASAFLHKCLNASQRNVRHKQHQEPTCFCCLCAKTKKNSKVARADVQTVSGV